MEPACKKSMDLLKVRYLDLYLVHWPVTGNRGADLWVDKHRPVRSSELVGNPGAIGTLRQWLVMW